MPTFSSFFLMQFFSNCSLFIQSILRHALSTVTKLMPKPSWLSSWLKKPPLEQEVVDYSEFPLLAIPDPFSIIPGGSSQVILLQTNG